MGGGESSGQRGSRETSKGARHSPGGRGKEGGLDTGGKKIERRGQPSQGGVLFIERLPKMPCSSLGKQFSNICQELSKQSHALIQ